MTTLNQVHGGTYAIDNLVDGGNVTDRRVVGEYIAYCYGENGDDAGQVPLAVLTVDVDGATVYVAAEVPDECTVYHSSHDSAADAEAACAELAKSL